MLAPLLRISGLDDDPLPPAPPRALGTAALPLVDDEFAITIVAGDDEPLQAIAPYSRTAALQVVDDESLSFVLEDEPVTSPRIGRPYATTVIPQVDEDLSFVVSDGDDDLRVASGTPLRSGAAPAVDDEVLSFVIEEGDDAPPPRAARVLHLVEPLRDEESVVVVLDDGDDSRSPTVGLKISATESLRDEEIIVVALEDGDETRLVAGPRPSGVSTQNADEELAFPIEDEADGHAPPILQLVRSVETRVVDDELTPVLIEDEEADPRRTVPPRHLRVVPQPADDEEFVVPPTPPPPVEGPPKSGGYQWWDRDEDPSEFLAEAARLVGIPDAFIDDDGNLVYDYDHRRIVIRGDEPETGNTSVWTTSLLVAVHATVLHVEVVERGNLLFFVAPFVGDPDEVFFSYIEPGKNRPSVDPGYGQRGTQIRRTDEGVYIAVVDTTGFEGGKLEWHFWGTGANQASSFGEVEIRNRPPQLL